MKSLMLTAFWLMAGVAPITFNSSFSEESSAVTGKPAPAVKVPERPRKIIRMRVTGYCPCDKCCGKWASDSYRRRKTAAQDSPFIFDGVAADPVLLPYRTRIFIPGIGIKEVDDTGKAMRRAASSGVYHIDIRMPLHSQGRAWGDQWLNVEVIDDLNQPLAITMPPASRTSLDSSRGNRSGAFSQSGSSGRR